MTAGQQEFSLRGDINEQFAGLLLSELAFVTRVRRPLDVGHDLICVLKEPDERNPDYLRAGPSFTVQVKSNYDHLRFTNENEVQWLKNQEIPFFVCVVDRDNFSIEFYSTWNVHNSYLWCAPAQLTLKLNELINPDEPTYPRTKPKCRKKQFVPLGEPILKILITDIWDSEKINYLRGILKSWILLEQENIVNIRAKMHWVVGCVSYETNQNIPQARNLFVYYNLHNLQFYVRNLGRTTTLLRLALDHAFEGKEREFVTKVQVVDVLDEFLKTYMDQFDPEVRILLQELQKKKESQY